MMHSRIKYSSYKAIVLFLLTIVLSSCPDKKEKCQYQLSISNGTTKDIYFYLKGGYPDTSISSYNPTGTPHDYKIAATSVKQVTFGPDYCIESQLQIYPTLELFLFDANTLLTVPWDTIRKKYLILKRYDLTFTGLQNSNWIILYP